MSGLREAMRRLSSLVNRVVLAKLDNDHKNQKWLVRGVEEQDKEVEVFEPYGFTTQPRVNETAELLRFSLEGYEDHTVSLGATGGSDRPRDGKAGEVIIYTRWDKVGDEHSKHRIIATEDGEEIRHHVGDTVFKVTRSGVEVIGDLKVSGKSELGGSLEIGGSVDAGSYKKNGFTVL